MVMLESRVSQSLKSRTCEIYGVVKKAPEAARSVVTSIRQIGVMEKTKDLAKVFYIMSKVGAKNLYDKYKPVALESSLLAWYKLRQVRVVPKIMEVLLLPIAYCVQKKYNYRVQLLNPIIYLMEYFRVYFV